jgi:putative flippase GtrA
MNDEQTRILRFLFAGGLNTAFGYGAFAALIWADIEPNAAVVLSTIVGIAFNYGTYGKVFAAQGFARLPAFIAVYAALLLANIALLRTFMTAGTGPYLGQALVLIVVVPITYLALKRFVFVGAPEPSP